VHGHFLRLFAIAFVVPKLDERGLDDLRSRRSKLLLRSGDELHPRFDAPQDR